MDINAVVGKNVKHHREAKGFSQEQLAFEADLHRTYISGVERGVRNPTVLIIAKLADALGVKPSKLLELEE
ncbi:helix-turn-helix domain-containing protein [Cognatishimia maritima]|uniref:Helix-turn-helix n=1 Tax=Cognatishimia maritima TaxID=870908 RepID=A0A1M5PIL5_9RHOB|nr:helix-turn-helix transcriptional regulator [Cognatishimia maritima]SHH01597.1 Helix-turn-helix [Cognatishimia maritima]